MNKIVFILLSFLSLTALAQTESEIRAHYTDVNQQISQAAEQGYEGSLYQNQWVSNKNGKSWPAVGNYSEVVDYWYNDPPGHLPAEERNPRSVLLKINLRRQASHYKLSEEYLFRNGKLLFYYAHEAEEGNVWETRVYFNDKGVMFKSSVKANDKELTAKEFLTDEFIDLKPKSSRILSAARKFQELFEKSML